MSDQVPTSALDPLDFVPSPDSYNHNLNCRAEELLIESREHAGKLVARSLDGRETYGYAETYPEIYDMLRKQGRELHEAVIGTVLAPGETTILF